MFDDCNKYRYKQIFTKRGAKESLIYVEKGHEIANLKQITIDGKKKTIFS